MSSPPRVAGRQHDSPITSYRLFLFFFLLFVVSAPLMEFVNNNKWVPIIAVIASLTSFIIGYGPSAKKHMTLVAYKRLKYVPTFSESSYFITGIIIILLMAVYSSWYYQGIPEHYSNLNSNFAGILSSEDTLNKVSEYRYLKTKAHWFGENWTGQGLWLELMKIGWRSVTCFCIVVYSCFRELKFGLIAGLSALCGAYFIGGTGERWPLVEFILSSLVILSFTQLYRRKLGFLGLAVVTLIAFIYTIGSGKLDNRSQGITDTEFTRTAISQLTERVLVGNGVHDVEVINLISDRTWSTRMGMYHVEKLVSSLPGIRMGTPLGTMLTRERLQTRNATTFSSGTYLGFIYADFGLVGCCIVFFLLGKTVSLLQEYFYKRPKTILRYSLALMAFFFLGTMYSYGIIGLLTSLIIAGACLLPIMLSLRLTQLWTIKL